MPHVTIEYTIMVPLLILQIFLFPLAAGLLMNIWVDSRRALALQDSASHLGSTVQQLYFSLNHETIGNGTRITNNPGVPPLIEDHYFTATSAIRAVSALPNSTKILALTLALTGTQNKVTLSVILGPNAQWQNSTYMSNSTHAAVSAQKFNGAILLRFGE